MSACRYILALGCIVFASSSVGLEPDQLFAKVSPSVVVVIGYVISEPDKSTLGSGVVIKPGEIITNCHVIEDAETIFVNRGKKYARAELKSADKYWDLCLISVEDNNSFNRPISGITPLSELRVGQRVYAIGAPEGLELTLSDGLISAIRTVEGVGSVIQITAPISHGSSGGGLFDSDGKLIGITSFVLMRGQNLNFAIPATLVSQLSERLALQEAKERGRAKELQRLVDEKSKLEAELSRIEEEMRQREEETRRRDEAKKLTEDLRREEEARRIEEAQREEEANRQAGAPEQQRPEAEAARQRAEAEARVATARIIADYVARIQAKVRGRVIIPPNIQGNPQAVYRVTLLPGGDVLVAQLVRSSGVPEYDSAVERAIMAAQPLPVPSDPNLFASSFKVLELRFRPRE